MTVLIGSTTLISAFSVGEAEGEALPVDSLAEQSFSVQEIVRSSPPLPRVLNYRSEEDELLEVVPVNCDWLRISKKSASTFDTAIEFAIIPDKLLPGSNATEVLVHTSCSKKPACTVLIRARGSV